MDSITIGLLAVAGIMLALYLKRRRGRLKNNDFQ